MNVQKIIFIFSQLVYISITNLQQILIGLVVPATRVVLWKRCSKKFAKSQKNICAGVSISIKLQASTSNFIQASARNSGSGAQKKLRQRCFPVNFAKFLRTPLLQNTSRWLLFALSYIICIKDFMSDELKIISQGMSFNKRRMASTKWYFGIKFKR